MKTTHIPKKWQAMNTLMAKYTTASKLLFTLLLGVGLALFGDVLFATVGHFLHVLISIPEWGCEHLLQWLFKLSPRQAEIMTFWLGFTGLSGAAWPVFRKIHASINNAYGQWLAKLKPDRYVTIMQFVVMGSVLAMCS
jgi:uncharacterized membrane protein